MYGTAGVPPKQFPTLLEHSYSGMSGSHSTGSTESCSSKSEGPRYTTLSTMGRDCEVLLNKEPTLAVSKESCTVGKTISLLSSSYEHVGTAVTMTGNQVHGHYIPDGFVKIAINEIKPGLKPLVTDIDGELTTGCITAWPIKFIKQI